MKNSEITRARQFLICRGVDRNFPLPGHMRAMLHQYNVSRCAEEADAIRDRV